MKTMCLTPMTVDLSQDPVKFLLFISPVYPHVV